MSRSIRIANVLLGGAIVVILAVTLIGNVSGAQQQKDWEAFSLEDLAERRAESGSPFLRFLDRDTLITVIYELPAGGVDNQTPHKFDEVYYVVSGKAQLSVGGDEVPVRAGSVVYVKRELEHRFHSIEEDLKVLVFFSRASGGDDR